MATVTQHIYKVLHGEGVANCGEYPYIGANFDITFNVSGNNVSWYVSNNTYAGTDTGEGYYGYPFYALISINNDDPSDDDTYYIIKKGVTSGPYWWNSVSCEAPSGSFTSSAKIATVYIWVQGGPDSCMSGGHFCYTGSNTLYLIDTVDVVIRTDYTISYNGNGGSPVPQAQTKPEGSSITLSSITPVRPISVTYHNSPNTTRTYNRSFQNWTCSADSQVYAPGATFSYNLTSDCTMTAGWGDAWFNPMLPTTRNFRVEYNANGGTSSVNVQYVPQTFNGYALTSGGQIVWQPTGPSYHCPNSIDFYPSFGGAVVPYNQLPTATKDGYILEGWYKEAELINKITSDYTINDNTTIYAKWIPAVFHQMGSDHQWHTLGTKLWRYVEDNEGHKSWQQIADVYRYDGTNWVKIS